MLNKKKLPVLPIAIFCLAFGLVVWYGYTHFYHKDLTPVALSQGLNPSLPVAQPILSQNKLELYMQAEKDSLAHNEQKANDPYARNSFFEEKLRKESKQSAAAFSNLKRPVKNAHVEFSDNTYQQQLASIYKLINEKPVDNKSRGKVNADSVYLESSPIPGLSNGQNVSIDPELLRLESMLDKLVTLQQPVSTGSKSQVSIKSVDSALRVTNTVLNQAIHAVVHNTQVVYDGATVKLRLQSDIQVGASLIPRGTFIYGVCSIGRERVSVELSRINFKNHTIPVSLVVLDIDGIEGIHISGNLPRELINEGTERVAQSLNLTNYNPSVSSILAGAGLEAGKSLLLKKTKLQTASLKANHQVLLQNTTSF